MNYKPILALAVIGISGYFFIDDGVSQKMHCPTSPGVIEQKEKPKPEVIQKPKTKIVARKNTERGKCTKHYITLYYSPMFGQSEYYLGRTYEQDYKMNCMGDCTRTANGTNLNYVRPFTGMACPPNMRLGSSYNIEGFGKVTCYDRGGAIKGKRLDVWAGIGQQGLKRLYASSYKTGYRNVCEL